MSKLTAKQKAELERLAKEKEEEERKKKEEAAERRWRFCLQTLRDAGPQLKKNPWLFILEPTYIHNYLDCLTDTLANLSSHESELDEVRKVLQDVYGTFVDISKFAKFQPGYFISNPHTMRRLVRLLDQVAHRGSDKALFPNVLAILGPTFERSELYDLLADAGIVHSLMSFARTDWLPNAPTLNTLFKIFEQMTTSERVRTLFMEDPGYDKLQMMARGLIQGTFTVKQQSQAMQALRLFPPWSPPENMEEALEADPAVAAGAGGASAGAGAGAEPASPEAAPMDPGTGGAGIPPLPDA